jgi:hypothetical protein
MHNNQSFHEWFETFLSEKNLSFEVFEIEIEQQIHMINSETVIDLIKKASPEDQRAIKRMLVALDFRNADINDYLKHLGKGYIVSNYYGEKASDEGSINTT